VPTIFLKFRSEIMASPEIIDDYRLVISGVGGPTPNGYALEHRTKDGPPTAWENTVAGIDGIIPIGETDIVSYSEYEDYESLVPIRLGGGVKENIDKHPFLQDSRAIRHASKYWGRAGEMLAIAIHQALESALVDLEAMDRWRIGHYIGSVFGGNGHSHYVDQTKEKIGVSDGTKDLFAQVGLGPVSYFDLRGRGGVEAVECTSSAFAVESGINDLLPQQLGRELRQPKADMVIVGGTDSVFIPRPLAHFVKAFRGAPDIETEDPRQAPRPFDRKTKGFVPGEGAVVMVVEPWHKAQERGLKEQDILAEIVGFSGLTHAHNVTLAGLEGQVRTMRASLEMAGVTVNDLGYVRAHGTGTIDGDSREALAARIALFNRLGLDPNNWHINSTMWASGHIMGPTAILGLYFAAMSVKNGETPRPRKITDPIPELIYPSNELKLEKDLAELAKQDLPQFPEENVTSSTSPTIAVTNSYGFSGGGESIVVRKFKA
jgi:3-oxoacyl-[acyl-carrier-protein] synthase II